MLEAREKKKQKERAEKYNCDGKCYWSTGMCGGVEWCEATRKKELIASISGVLLMFGIPILALVGVVVFIILCIIFW